MRKWLWTIVVIPILGGLLQACAPKHEEQPDCGFVQNVYGERISWKSQSVDLAIHESVPTEMVAGIEAAVRDWETAVGYPVFRIVSTRASGNATPKQDGVNMIYWLNTWEADKPSEQARTSVYWVGDRIRESDIRINAKNFSFYVEQPKAYRDVHLESLLVHELGHVLGLKHKDDTASVMGTYLASQTVRVNLSEKDRENVKCEY